MRNTLIFTKRVIKEILRDPIIYIFGIGFPLVMLLLFQIINNYTGEENPVFRPKSLIPGILIFSATFIMMVMALMISKDRSTSLLKRLYTSPLKASNYILGYAIPGMILGIIQMIICIISGFVISLICKNDYFSFGSACLLMLTALPNLIICIFLGLLFGTLLNDKSAPGIVSVFISASGILGGCWMPLDVMGNFETICRFLPFYPSVSLGRMVTGAMHTNLELYKFDNNMIIGIIVILIYLLISVILSIIAFKKQMTNEK